MVTRKSKERNQVYYFLSLKIKYISVSFKPLRRSENPKQVSEVITFYPFHALHPHLRHFLVGLPY